MDSTPALATAPLRSTSLRSPSLRRAAAKVAGDGRPLIFLFNMLIILLALHSNSDYEECLSYVGTEGCSSLTKSGQRYHKENKGVDRRSASQGQAFIKKR